MNKMASFLRIYPLNDKSRRLSLEKKLTVLRRCEGRKTAEKKEKTEVKKGPIRFKKTPDARGRDGRTDRTMERIPNTAQKTLQKTGTSAQNI